MGGVSGATNRKLPIFIMSETLLSPEVYNNEKVEIQCGPDCQDAGKCLCSSCHCCSECSSKCEDCPGTSVKSPTAELAKLLELSITTENCDTEELNNESDTSEEWEEKEEEDEEEGDLNLNVMLIDSDENDDAV